jgi:hypothetical protein
MVNSLKLIMPAKFDGNRSGNGRSQEFHKGPIELAATHDTDVGHVHRRSRAFGAHFEEFLPVGTEPVDVCERGLVRSDRVLIIVDSQLLRC